MNIEKKNSVPFSSTKQKLCSIKTHWIGNNMF